MEGNRKIFIASTIRYFMELEILEKIGLTRNESLVYLTLLKLGTSKTTKILNTSGLNSGKIYEILESLKKKGLVSESVINNIKHYTPSSPKELLDYIGAKKREVEKKEELVKSMLPRLEGLRNLKLNKSRAVIYTGFRGLKTAAYEGLNNINQNGEILAMGISEKKSDKLNEFWLKFTKDRVEKKIKARHIYSERGTYFKEFKKVTYTEHRVLEGITPVTVDIFGDEIVLLLNYEEPITCILIYDKNTAISFKNFFEQLWKIAKS